MGLGDTYGDTLDPVAEDPLVDDHPVGEGIEPGTREALRDVLERNEGPVSTHTLRTEGGYDYAHPIGAAYRLGDDLKEMREDGEVEKVDYRHYVMGATPSLDEDTPPGTAAAIREVLASASGPRGMEAIGEIAAFDNPYRLGTVLARMEQEGQIEQVDEDRYMLPDR